MKERQFPPTSSGGRHGLYEFDVEDLLYFREERKRREYLTDRMIIVMGLIACLLGLVDLLNGF